MPTANFANRPAVSFNALKKCAGVLQKTTASTRNDAEEIQRLLYFGKSILFFHEYFILIWLHNTLPLVSFKELQIRIANADESALKELHDQLYKRLLHGAMTITRSRDNAEEIVSDVFIKIWVNRSRLLGVDNLDAYLFTITRNLSLDYLRKVSGKHFYDIDEAELPMVMVGPSAEDTMISGELIKKINNEINNLPPKCRLIFKLVKVDELKYKEVAALLDISIKTVENQMSIALKKLHLAIQPQIPSAFQNTVR